MGTERWTRGFRSQWTGQPFRRIDWLHITTEVLDPNKSMASDGHFALEVAFCGFLFRLTRYGA